jgi:D-alanyl-D-alanine carboxypeptidase/D-alanyl-D-alanine-endopeptidase (penicillin-binding protein 4)
MKNTKAQNNLRGKTGTLRNVSALSGFVNNQDGETYVFSILSNGSSPYKYKRMENEIGEALAEFYYTDGSGKRRP